jgi:hypothetical protein
MSTGHHLDMVDNVAMTSRTDLSERESLSNDSRRMTLTGVVTGVGTSPRQALQPGASWRSQPGGPAFCRFPRHQFRWFSRSKPRSEAGFCRFLKVLAVLGPDNSGTR